MPISKSSTRNLRNGLVCGVGLIALVFLLSVQTAWGKDNGSQGAQALYGKAKKSYYQLVQSRVQKPLRKDWVRVIKMFQQVAVRFPKSNEAYKATFTAGRLHQKLGNKLSGSEDLRQARHYFVKLLKNFKVGRLHDDTLYHIAEIQISQKDFTHARKTLRRILDKYPDGDKVGATQVQLKNIERLLVVDSTQANPRYQKQTAHKKPKAKGKIPLVVLDPGHGGKDYGATGPTGLMEKEINLKLSKFVRDILVKKYKLKVLLTREDDAFIELADRGKVANEKGADLFVSIHANAAKRKSAKGIETYYLGTGSTEQARETAARENGKLVHSVADNEVQEILASLISTTKINDSSRLAAIVQKELHKHMAKKYSKIQDLGVKEGPFFVLHDASMPSILIEVGFVTNRMEEERLKKEKYLKELAQAIARSVYTFLKQKAPSI